MARDQVEVMRQLGFEQFYLAGHDRGARCAYRLALDHPERVRKLAVLDIIPTVRDVPTRRTWSSACGPGTGSSSPSRRISRSGRSPARPRYFSSGGRRASGRPRRAPTTGAATRIPETIRAICEDYRAGAGFDFNLDKADVGTRKITCPVLVLWGEQSWSTMGWDFLAIWREWADDVRGRGLNSGHFLAEEVPDETYAELRAFFSA